MSNKMVSAIESGFNYQRLIFWQNAFKLLQSNTEIALVQYEESKHSPCDDVVVYYNKTIFEEDLNCYYDTDYIQCKFKVDDSKPICFYDLMDPKYYGNKESFIKRAFDFYKGLENKNVRLFLYTTVNPNPSDVFFRNISKVNNSLRIDELIKQEKNKDIFNQIKTHLNADEEEMLTFLSKLRFYLGRSIEEEKAKLSDICKSVEVIYDRSKIGDTLSEILRKMNLSKRTDFKFDTIKTICINNDLFIKQENHIGIVSYDWQDDKCREALSKSIVLDLRKYFDGRKIKQESNWDDAKNDIKAFCANLKFNENHLFTLSSSFSVCFAVGKQLGHKIGNITFNNRAGIFSESLFEPSIENSQEKKVYIDENTIIDDAVLVFSFNDDILSDVKDYLNENAFSGYGLFYLKYENVLHTISNNDFWEGVKSFCEKAKAWIKKKKAERIHLFYRGPAEGIFVIGQNAKEWGECIIYEFNFGASPREQKYYKGITI